MSDIIIMHCFSPNYEHAIVFKRSPKHCIFPRANEESNICTNVGEGGQTYFIMLNGKYSQ